MFYKFAEEEEKEDAEEAEDAEKMFSRVKDGP